MFINIDNHVINSKYITRIGGIYGKEETYFEIHTVNTIPVTITSDTKEELIEKRNKLKTLLNVKEL